MSPAVLAAAHGAATTGQDLSIGHVLLQMVVALGIVIGGIWGLGKCIHRSGRGGRAAGAGKARGSGKGRAAEHGLRVLSRQTVGKGKSIAVVQAGDQCFLVGIADSGLTPLGELKPAGADDDDDGGEEPAAGRPAISSSVPAASDLAGGTAWGTPATGGTPPLALAPLDFGSIDLSAFAEPPPPGGGRADGAAPAAAAPSMRSWLNALREATVRR
ncbi:MAG: flagellar biosynthetic protein FliO [Acidimicrobiales bacterium]